MNKTNYLNLETSLFVMIVWLIALLNLGLLLILIGGAFIGFYSVAFEAIKTAFSANIKSMKTDFYKKPLMVGF